MHSNKVIIYYYCLFSLDTPDKWLKCQLQQSLSSLKVVEAGLGHQTLWLTFSSPLSVNLVVRDELHVKSFKSQLAGKYSIILSC